MIEHNFFLDQTNRLFGAFGKLGQNGSPVGGMSWFAKELQKEIGHKLVNKEFDDLISAIIRGSDKLPSIAKVLEMTNNMLPEKDFSKDTGPPAKKGFVSVIGYLIKKQMKHDIPDKERLNIIDQLRAFNGFDASKEEIQEAKETIDSLIEQNNWPLCSSGMWANSGNWIQTNGHGGK